MDNSRHASIQDIVFENKKDLKTIEICQLFKPPVYENIDISSLIHNPMNISHPIFTFFIKQLQLWNNKIINNEVSPFSQTEFHKNLFVYNSLKKIFLINKNQINKELQGLHRWYTKNMTVNKEKKVIKDINNSKEDKKDQEWEVRKTFKSNQPLELDNYRRRYLFNSNQSKENNIDMFSNTYKSMRKQQSTINQSPSSNHLKFAKTNNFLYKMEMDDKYTNIYEENIKNKQHLLMKIKNNQLRNQRENKQIQYAQHSWNKICQRFQERSCQNFYKKFSSSNQKYFKETNNNNVSHNNFVNNKDQNQSNNYKEAKYKKIFNNTLFIDQRKSLTDQIKKYRIQTSQGHRFKRSQFLQKQFKKQKQNQQNLKTTQNFQENGENWIDKFTVQINDKTKLRRLLSAEGLNGRGLMSNPYDNSKKTVKKKKK